MLQIRIANGQKAQLQGLKKSREEKEKSNLWPISHSIIEIERCQKLKLRWGFIYLVLEFELRALYLTGKCSVTQARPPALFVLCYFSDRASWFLSRPDSDCISPYLCLMHSWYYSMHTHADFFVEMRYRYLSPSHMAGFELRSSQSLPP
jgi:hypothetical protein